MTSFGAAVAGPGLPPPGFSPPCWAMAAALSIEGGQGGFFQYPVTGTRHNPCPLAGLRYDCGHGLVRKRPLIPEGSEQGPEMLENKEDDLVRLLIMPWERT